MVYSVLAPFYDNVMKHVHYDEWFDLIKNITTKFSLPKSASILEIGGGTGNLGLLLKKAGFDYTGSDFSYHMSYQANTKGLSFFCADGRYPPLKKKFDLVIFLYDGINYLPTLNDYEQLFNSIGLILNKNGFFLFDITTCFNSLQYFLDFADLMEINGNTIFRHSFFIKKNSTQINKFTIFSPVNFSNQLYEKFTEHHTQKLFAPDRIRSVIPKHYFECTGIWDNFSMNHYSSSSERIHFLLQKKI